MHASFPTLKTNRLLLRQFTDADLPLVFKGLSHPAVIRYYGVCYDSLEATKTQLQFFADLEANKTGIWWAVCAVDNGAFLGAGGFSSWSHVHQKAEIGFWLLPEYWGKGIMTEAMRAICNYGFAVMDLHRIEAFVETENFNCKKALAKLNFQQEGTLRECEVKNGNFISLDIYAQLAAGSV